MIYDGDPELRKTLERSDVANFTVEEKFQIIEAYMAGGGAAGLQIELEEDDDEKELAEVQIRAGKMVLRGLELDQRVSPNVTVY